MTSPAFNVLFVCTGNSARSILAEALMNQLGAGRFKAWSAGSHPTGEVHPLAVEVLQSHGVGTDGLRSKGWEEFGAPGAPDLHFVFTVCDRAAGEACPVWPGQPLTAHWGLPDPAGMQGPVAAQRKAFADAFITLKRRIELMLALPIQSLDRLTLQTRVRDIGNQ